jgi:hypothetical protein
MREPVPPAPPAPERDAAPWPWLAAGIVVGALLALVLRRRRGR